MAKILSESTMRRILLTVVLSALLLIVSACDHAPGCTQCGFGPGEHILTTYTDAQGATVYISGYANSEGCFTPDGCL